MALLCVGMVPLGAVELPPPEQGGPQPGVDIVVGDAGAQPADIGEVLALGAPGVVGAGPQITFQATEPGWVHGQQAVFVITGSPRPWMMSITGTAMALEAGSPDQYIPQTRIEVHDAKKPTDWATLSGGSELWNLAGEKDMWMQIEFRILVEAGDAAGHYKGDVFLEWTLLPEGGQLATTGSIPLELHLDIPQFFEVSFDFTELNFGTLSADFQGWAYSDTEGTLFVRSNRDFQISINPGPDLTGPDDHELETALCFRQPTGSGAHWMTWGDLGADPNGQSPPWGGAPDPGSPWPGALSGLIYTQGDNYIGVSAAAYRQGVRDPAGDYNSIITITVSVP